MIAPSYETWPYFLLVFVSVLMALGSDGMFDDIMIPVTIFFIIELFVTLSTLGYRNLLKMVLACVTKWRISSIGRSVTGHGPS
jgi:hypothetical protein